MKFIMTLIWALLIGGALGYILTSMAGNPFNITQSLVYAVGVFIAILVMDGILGGTTEEQS